MPRNFCLNLYFDLNNVLKVTLKLNKVSLNPLNITIDKMELVKNGSWVVVYIANVRIANNTHIKIFLNVLANIKIIRIINIIAISLSISLNSPIILYMYILTKLKNGILILREVSLAQLLKTTIYLLYMY